jgi:hypothetical protein
MVQVQHRYRSKSVIWITGNERMSEDIQQVTPSLEVVRPEHLPLMMLRGRATSGTAAVIFQWLLGAHGFDNEFPMPLPGPMGEALGVQWSRVRDSIDVLVKNGLIKVCSGRFDPKNKFDRRTYTIDSSVGILTEEQVIGYHKFMGSVIDPPVNTRKPKIVTPKVIKEPVADPVEPKVETPKKRKSKVVATPEEKAAKALMVQATFASASKSARHMEAYLLHGKDGLALFDENPNRPWSEVEATGTTALNWRKMLRVDANGNVILMDESRPEGLERWTTPTFLGYYWYLVSVFMSQRGFPIYPPNIKKLAGLIQRYLEAYGPVSTFDRVVTLGTRFDVVMDLVNKRDSIPGEDSFSNALVEQAYRQYCTLTPEQKIERFNMIRSPQ